MVVLKRLLALFALLFALPLRAALPLTPFELTPQQPLPKSAVVSRYLHTLDEASAQASLVRLGTSAGGRPVEALLISRDDAFLKLGQLSASKPTVMLLGSQHGNEPSGTEALQILARRLLAGELPSLLDNMNFVVVALANPDGRDLNRRLNARDENPNLDFIAVESPETRIYIDALARFQPDVVMDLHETWNDKWPMTPREGYLTTTDAQFEVGNNPNLDAELRRYANQHFLPALIEAVSKSGIPAQRYSEIYSVQDPVRRGGLSLSNFRNYATMQGALTVLFENRHDGKGRFPTPMNIAERVRKQLLCVQRALELVQEESLQIRELARRARAKWQGSEGADRYVLQYGFTLNREQPSVPVTLKTVAGKEVVKQLRQEDEVAVNGIGQIPPGYVVQTQVARFRHWLDSHHIRYQVVQQKGILTVNQQRVASMHIAEHTRPGTRDWLDVTLDEKLQEVELEPGDLLVPTNQPQGALLAIMLDPRSANSLYQEPQWRPLLLTTPLPTAPLPDKETQQQIRQSALVTQPVSSKGKNSKLNG